MQADQEHVIGTIWQGGCFVPRLLAGQAHLILIYVPAWAVSLRLSSQQGCMERRIILHIVLLLNNYIETQPFAEG